MLVRTNRPGKFNATVAVAVVGVIAAIVIVLVLVLQGSSRSRLEPFPTAAYLASPQNFLGNSYQVDAQVDSMLVYRPGLGRLLVVKSEGKSIPVFLEDGLADSIHTGQRYHMDVNVGEGGLLYVIDLQKY
ncbi:hypothetical protein [Cerasicoccus maritimus]|uniref:hypothetical protein n=1 Tax=Cerasicoccus maritimus TaxID=490089 RepID=UPI0028527231|nr:hypothetical protein [Cerasicoccus maritimus]